MKFKDLLLDAQLINDDDKLKITIHEDDSVLKESWTGEWFSDRILEHSDLDIIQILYDPVHGWHIFLRR